MRNKSRSTTLADWVSRARYEILPTPTIAQTVLEHVPLARTLTVTASPAQGIDGTVELAESLARQGYDMVPHLAARMISGRGQLGEISARLTEAGVRTVFVPGGDQDPPAGDYTCALDLLEDLTALGSPFPGVGITGYPESHPSISDDLTVQSMWDKRRHATHVVSNLSFDPDVITDWVRRLRSRGIALPLLLGVPGPVERTKLLAMASRIGVGDSTRFLAKHKGTLARLAAPGGFTGERFLERCVPRLGDLTGNVAGIHVYTFNQVAATEQWRTDLLARLGASDPVAGSTEA